MFSHGEIVGLRASSNGSCANHDCCGSTVVVGSKISFEQVFVQRLGFEERALCSRNIFSIILLKYQYFQ